MLKETLTLDDKNGDIHSWAGVFCFRILFLVKNA